MRRLLFAVLAVLPSAGCGLIEPGRKPGQTLPGRPVSGIKPVRNPANEDWTVGPGPRGAAPKSAAPNPSDPNFNVARERRELLGGIVEDPSGRPAARVAVEYSPTDGSDGPGAILDTLTDERGRFLIRGLEADRTYILTARASSEGKTLAGRIYARTASSNAQQLRVLLVEGLTLPGPSAGTTGPKSDTPPRGKAGGNTPPNRPFDTYIPPSVQPSAGANPSPIPLNAGLTSGGDLPPPRRNDDIRDLDSSPTMPTLPPAAGGTGGPRPELRTDIPQPFYPPVTNIPGTNARKPTSPTVGEFELLDAEGTSREFGAGKPRELILIEWMTTTCGPCKEAIPLLNRLTTSYAAKGLEVIAVVSDQVPAEERRRRAKAYTRAYDVKYRLFTESGATPGTLHERYDVESYPTLTLIDNTGRTLWQGHPADAKNLEAVLRSVVGR